MILLIAVRIFSAGYYRGPIFLQFKLLELYCAAVELYCWKICSFGHDEIGGAAKKASGFAAWNFFSPFLK